VLAGVLALPLAGCIDTDGILSVDDPEFPTNASLRDPNALPLLVRGAQAEFFRAYGGSGLDNLGFSTAVGLFTDEFNTTDTFVDRNALDRRELQAPALGNSPDFAFNRLQRARRAARDARAAVTEVRGATDPDVALLFSLEGYSYVALAEGFCSGVPISNAEGGTFQGGTPQSTEALLDSAVNRFQAALAVNPTGLPAADQTALTRSQNLARVGLGRALLNLNRPAEAAAAVNAVPNTFTYLVEHSENTFQNSFWNLNNNNGRFSVAEAEGGRGLPFRLAADPRLPVTRTGTRVGFDNQTPLFEQQKYANRDADLVLADFREARLIEAEAALRAGDVATFLQRLNTLRAGVTGLTPLTDPGTQAARVDLLFRERAFWMFATGHRLGDFRRLVKQYNRPVNQVYPSGAYFLGGTFGNDVVFPVPFNEEQNESFTRAQCNTTQV
jgi:hypothetical protein